MDIIMKGQSCQGNAESQGEAGKDQKVRSWGQDSLPHRLPSPTWPLQGVWALPASGQHQNLSAAWALVTEEGMAHQAAHRCWESAPVTS